MGLHKPLFLVLSGDGINCERETASAFVHAGGDARILHINDLLAAPEKLAAYDGMAIPGGFSFGDELGSGQIMALKIRHKLGDAFARLVEKQKPVIGICNGFQVLVKLGLLPFPDAQKRLCALAPNAHGGFVDRWVTLLPQSGSRCIWTAGIENAIRLPARHGEGRIVFAEGQAEELHRKLQQNGQIPFCYETDINGSYARIAALCDPTGYVLGLMPHPEAFMHAECAPNRQTQQPGDGFILFDNIIRHLQGQEKRFEKRIA